MDDNKHYCTGCGVEAEKQCSVCGEWRCDDVHLTIGGWCCPYPGPEGGTERGTWCAWNRGGYEFACEHAGNDHRGVTRKVTYGATTGSTHFAPGLTHRHCVAHLERNARNGWLWKEHGAPAKVAFVEGKPRCFGGPQCCSCNNRGCEYHNFHNASPNGGEGVVRSPVTEPSQPARLVEVYCENAPPREVVESTMVTLDGDECGAVALVPHLKTHLVWNLHMQYEWERHQAYWRRVKRMAFRRDAETVPPLGPDIYGGCVERTDGGNLHRCALCGAWMRRRKVTR